MEVKAFSRNEIKLYSTKQYDNPFTDVEIDATFAHSDGTVISIPGFWNGENEWKVRYSFEKAGTWNYSIICSDKDNLSLTCSGTITVTALDAPKTELEKHGYIRLEDGAHYMVYNDGTPFFYLGDTHWMMPDYERLHECNYPGCNCGNQFKHLVDDRVKKGFTVYQTYFAMQRAGVSCSGTESWWQDGEYKIINPNAFNSTMDIMIEYLTEQGIVTALGFGTHYSTPKVMKENVTAMKAFARYCVARYACYPIVWITAQEITNYKFNAFECWKQVGAYVGELDGYHRPNGAHMHVHAFEESRSIELNKEPWHQWWTVQGGHGGYHRLRYRNFYRGYFESNKMFIETECQYEDIYCSGFCGHDAPRMGAWQAMQCGSGGFTYGATGIWVLSWDQHTEPTMTNYSPESWYEAIDKEGSYQVGYMKDFYQYVGWWDLEPSFDYSLANVEDRIHTSISHKGQDVFVYYLFSLYKETGIATGLKPGVRYQARWFDPIMNNFIDLPDIITEDGSFIIPQRPSYRDWVLLVNCVDLGPYKKGTYPEIIKPIPASEASLGAEIPVKSIRTSSHADGHPAENMLDGNKDTYWVAFKGRTSQIIDIDLGEEREIGYLNLETTLQELRFVQFRVTGSSNGTDYELITERNYMDVAMGGAFLSYFEPIERKYRYLRFFLNSTDGENTSEPIPFTKLAVYEKADKSVIHPLKADY